jgi:hypothetical protein
MIRSFYKKDLDCLELAALLHERVDTDVSKRTLFCLGKFQNRQGNSKSEMT